MKTPFFSVVIPTYNRGALLLETLSSVQKQSFTDWECIVVDDGSTDDTGTVVNSIDDDRIKYVYQENAERSVARNNGVKHATGKYVCFLDSDDEYLPDHLAILYRSIEQNGSVPAMYFTYSNHLIDGKVTVPNYGNSDTVGFEYLMNNPITPTRVCIHRQIFEDFLFDENVVVVEDLLLWLKIKSKYPVVQVPEYTVNYVLHDDNSVNLKNNCFVPRLAGLIFFSKAYPEIYKQIGLSLWNKTISNTLFGIARHYIFIHKYMLAFFYLLRSVCRKVKHEQTRHRLLLILHLVVYRLLSKQSQLLAEYQGIAGK